MSNGKEPFCSNCGYQLTGLVDSSKCPECGKPIVEVLTRSPASMRTGKRYRSKTTVFGLPLVHVAMGPKDDELRGRARGIIAIGDTATGFLALGGFAWGGIAIGGMAVGLIAVGGMAIGLLACLGGGAVGGLASGGGAVGAVAQGGGAVGIIADGGGAYGYLARGEEARGTHTVTGSSPDSPEAARLLDRWSWLIGRRPGTLVLPLWVLVVLAATGALMTLVVALGYVAQRMSRSRPVEYR
ncbi:MAG: zinc ribbon domain-containing protein [Phycisphaerales bacterium]|nr:MAG: zinc ribbon domain-containing protein [Phycisphaerales bacterium]